MDLSNINGQTLAYLGDAYYELIVRKYFVDKGYRDAGKLHGMASKCTSSVAQAKAINHLIDNELLTDDEVIYFKKGRNATLKTKRKVDLATYQQATGFEALIGYLEISNLERCNEVILIVITYLVESEVLLGGKSS